jgi:hypothetical protein
MAGKVIDMGRGRCNKCFENTCGVNVFRKPWYNEDLACKHTLELAGFRKCAGCGRPGYAPDNGYITIWQTHPDWVAEAIPDWEAMLAAEDLEVPVQVSSGYSAFWAAAA